MVKKSQKGKAAKSKRSRSCLPSHHLPSFPINPSERGTRLRQHSWSQHVKLSLEGSKLRRLSAFVTIQNFVAFWFFWFWIFYQHTCQKPFGCLIELYIEFSIEFSKVWFPVFGRIRHKRFRKHRFSESVSWLHDLHDSPRWVLARNAFGSTESPLSLRSWKHQHLDAQWCSMMPRLMQLDSGQHDGEQHLVSCCWNRQGMFPKSSSNLATDGSFNLPFLHQSVSFPSFPTPRGAS